MRNEMFEKIFDKLLDGSFKSDFDYKDISADSLSYEEKWEESRMKHA